MQLQVLLPLVQQHCESIHHTLTNRASIPQAPGVLQGTSCIWPDISSAMVACEVRAAVGWGVPVGVDSFQIIAGLGGE